MALVINTTDDFIEAMRRNPEFLAAARREILTQELIELPEKFAKFRDEVLGRFGSQDGRFDKMDARFDSQDGRFDKMDARFDSQDGRFDKMDVRFDSQDGRFDKMDARFDSQDGRFDKMDTDIGVIRGIAIGSSLEKSGLSRMVSDFGLSRTRIVRLAEYNRVSEEFNEAAWNARDDGIISEAERIRLTVTDMIVRGRMGRTTNIAYIAAEASYTIDEDDIAKVRASVDALEKIFPDATVFACLYGANISDRLLSEAANRNISVYIEE